MISIDTLPDDALLVIFDHYLYGVQVEGGSQSVEEAWQSLVHVCHRWRSIVFESPRRLDLRLVCTGETPVRDRLDVWPDLPLIIQCDGYEDPIGSVDNIIAALERTDRVCQINLESVSSSDMETVLAAMQERFSELTNLHLSPDYGTVPVIPDSFLGGSAPRLEHFSLSRVPFPGLPKLLLSATQLVTLQLTSIPHSGYFPPDAVATVLPTLTSLNILVLQFIFPRSCPDRASLCPPPSTRSIIPVLTHFVFKGAGEYLEDLVAYIDAPQLESLHIIFFDVIVFDTPQVIQFISRTPKLKALEKAPSSMISYLTHYD